MLWFGVIFPTRSRVNGIAPQSTQQAFRRMLKRVDKKETTDKNSMLCVDMYSCGGCAHVYVVVCACMRCP